MQKSRIFVSDKKKFTVVLSATAVRCVSEQEGVQNVTQGHFSSSSRVYFKLMDTQQGSCYSSSLTFLHYPAYPGGASVKWMWMDVPCCFSVFPTLPFLCYPSIHLSICAFVFALSCSLKHTKTHVHRSLCPTGSFLQSPSDLLQGPGVSEQLFQLQTQLTPSGEKLMLAIRSPICRLLSDQQSLVVGKLTTASM